MALAGEPASVVAVAAVAFAASVFAFFEIASWVLGRPVLPALLGGGGSHEAGDGRHGWGDSWGDGDGGGGGGGGGGG